MKPKPISFSTLNNFNTCPRQYYEIKVAQSVASGENDAGRAGGYMHEQFESYLLHGTELPDAYPEDIRDWPVGLKTPAGYKEYLDTILAAPGDIYVEHKLGVALGWKVCEFDADNVWIRAVIDVLQVHGTRARIIDHKTGKRKPSNQLKLSALLVFNAYPNVEEITTTYAWLVPKVPDTDVWRRDEVPALWDEFRESLVRYNHAFRVERFIERQSGLCNGWCPVTECQHWKPKRAR